MSIHFNTWMELNQFFPKCISWLPSPSPTGGLGRVHPTGIFLNSAEVCTLGLRIARREPRQLGWPLSVFLCHTSTQQCPASSQSAPSTSSSQGCLGPALPELLMSKREELIAFTSFDSQTLILWVETSHVDLHFSSELLCQDVMGSEV